MDQKPVHIIEDQNPHDFIIRQIRRKLQSGELKPGMRLPAERKMAEEYGVSRTYVRTALKALESYGIVETKPQSGTFIVGLDISAIDGLFADILRLDAFDFASLAEMRAILEVNAARLSAERRSEEDLEKIHTALVNYEAAFERGDQQQIYTTDFEFHRCIAAASGNSTLRSMLMLITPDIMSIYQKQRICSTADTVPLEEHRLLYRFIAEKRPEVAAQLMKTHLDGMLQYAEALRSEPV
ncbi:MAG: FadR family transcriptional regulator [Paludibacteraceae bacterium]|nr:FadR family transcriptional regulator [Paludibacteraceae bacterium]